MSRFGNSRAQRSISSPRLTMATSEGTAKAHFYQHNDSPMMAISILGTPFTLHFDHDIHERRPRASYKNDIYDSQLACTMTMIWMEFTNASALLDLTWISWACNYYVYLDIPCADSLL